MNVQELERVKDRVNVDIRSAERGEPSIDESGAPVPPGSIVLYIPPSGAPCAQITDNEGRVTPKIISYLDLLYTLDDCATLQELKTDPLKRTPLPPLPPGTLLVDLFQKASETTYALTGVLEPATHLFILEYGEDIDTYELPMPHVAWRASWRESTKQLDSLSIAFVSPDHEGAVTPDTELYHYPFEHVYAGPDDKPENVCWPTLYDLRLDLRDIPEKAVAAFLNSPNKAGHARKMDTLLMESGIDAPHELLKEIERRGAIPHDWLTPAALNVRQLHDQRRRKS